MTGKLSFVATKSGGLRPEGDIATARLGALRAAREELHRWIVAVGDKAAVGPLSETDRLNMQAVRQYAAVVNSTLAERESANERERAEAARLDGRGQLDADTIASQRAAGALGLPGPARPEGK